MFGLSNLKISNLQWEKNVLPLKVSEIAWILKIYIENIHLFVISLDLTEKCSFFLYNSSQLTIKKMRGYSWICFLHSRMRICIYFCLYTYIHKHTNAHTVLIPQRHNSQGITTAFPDFAENHLKSWAQGFKMLSYVNGSTEYNLGEKRKAKTHPFLW